MPERRTYATILHTVGAWRLQRSLRIRCHLHGPYAGRFTSGVLQDRRAPEEDDAREVVRGQWGEAAVIDLTLATQIGRIFPMVKAGLGFSKTCRRVHVGDRRVDVVKAAA